MKILVTGANGYLGQGIIKTLLDEGNKVLATDFILNDVDSRAEFFPGNIFELENPYEYYGEPDIVLHLAWKDGFVHNSINHLLDLPNHYLFLKKLIDGGVKRICVLGSMHEVGFFEGSVKDNTPTNPLSLYGISKDALRNSLQLLTDEKRIDFQWIRGFYIVGNSPRGASIFSKIIKASDEGKTEFPFTQGKNQFDFIDYDDFCKQVASVVEQNEINGIINCCSGRPMKLSERVENFIEENGYSIKLNYGVFPDRPYDSKAIWGDNTKILKILKKKQ